MNKVIEERTKRTEWYRDARFGMFIHWGPVSYTHLTLPTTPYV